MTVASELLNCPFCGCTDIRPFDNSVVCNGCSGTGPDLGHCVGPECRAEAIAAWNRRAALEPVASPEVQKLVARAILAAQLRAFERGRIDTPDEIRAEAAAILDGDEAMSREGKAVKDEIQRNRNEAYQVGWDDGYSEGFAKALAIALDAFPATTAYGRGAKSTLRTAFEAVIRHASEGENP